MRLVRDHLGQRGFDRRRIAPRPVERLHYHRADTPVAQQGEQEQFYADAPASFPRRGLRRGVKDAPRILVEVFVELSQVHDINSTFLPDSRTMPLPQRLGVRVPVLSFGPSLIF